MQKQTRYCLDDTFEMVIAGAAILPDAGGREIHNAQNSFEIRMISSGAIIAAAGVEEATIVIIMELQNIKVLRPIGKYILIKNRE